MKDTVNIFGVESRDGKLAYLIEIYDYNGNLVNGASGSVINPNALDKVRFHIRSIYLPSVEYVSQIDREFIEKKAIEKGRNIEERVDGGISIEDGESNFIRPLSIDERLYLEHSLGVTFQR